MVELVRWSWLLLGFDSGAQFPKEGAEFPCHRYLDLVVMELAFSQSAEAVTKACLCGPGELFDPTIDAFLSLGELGADFGWNPVVGSLFDENPAGMGIAAFTDPALSFARATGVFGGNEAEVGHELLGVLETAEGADFRDGDHGGDEFEAFEGHHGIDERFALPVILELKHGLFESGDALDVEVDGGEVVFENPVVGGIREGEMTKVSFVCFGPMGFSVVVVAEASQEGEEAGFGSAEVIDDISAGATEVTNGFVGGVGNIDGNEVVGAEVFGEFHGVAFVGFDAVPGFGGNEGRGDDFTMDAHLKEAPSDPEPATARFVADVEIAELPVLVLGDAPHGPLQGVLGSGDGPVVTGFGFPICFEDGDDGFCFMDVESDVECLRCA